MNQYIFAFLKEYNTDIEVINRLITSAFVYKNSISVKKNQLIKSLLIEKDEESSEYKKVQSFLNLLKKYEHTNTFNIEALVELFEFVISPADKVINGAIYTPKAIREYITETAFCDYYGATNKSRDLFVADISCGCGGFLLNASELIHKKFNKSFADIYRDNIYGIDIQQYSVNRTKILLTLLALQNNEDEEAFLFNLYCGDSLLFNWRDADQNIKKNNGFDIILGNPPYVCSRNMDSATKQLMSNFEVCSTGHPDLYIPFFQIGYELLNENGILGFITVNTFLSSINGRAIRQYFKSNSVDMKIIDFRSEQIFKSRLTYTCLVFLKKIRSKYLSYVTTDKQSLARKVKYSKIKYDDLDAHSGWKLKDIDFIKLCESGKPSIGELYSTKSGIATLKNRIYIFKPYKEDGNFYYINDTDMVEKSICRNIVNSNLLVNEPNIDCFIEKILFPYTYHDSSNTPTVIPEERLKKDYPCAYAYLLKNRPLLESRDKGKGKDYLHWYAFGRAQALERFKYKLFFPEIAKKNFHCHLSADENLYFYNGMAAVSNKKSELQTLGKVLKSEVFWRYIESSSKNYNSKYFSLSRNYIKNFGIASVIK